jgi:membrane fusion protein (multidrug efflux system)
MCIRDRAEEFPKLKVLQIKSTKVPMFLQSVGQAEGIPTVEIRARVAGYLQSWTFKEGSVVQKGQVLFTIEPDEYKNNVDYSAADLESRMAAWDKAKLDVARLKPLLATNAISQNDYDKAVTTERQDRAAVESAKADLQQAKLNLSYTTITAPITGFIGAAMVRPGNLVGKGESTLLATISNVNPIYFNFNINETDYLKFMTLMEKSKEKGKEVMAGAEKVFTTYLNLTGDIQYPYPGKIDFIDREVNPQTGTIAMRAVFPNDDGMIKPGTFATVYLVLLEQQAGIVIPQSATTQIQGKNFIFKVSPDNKVSRSPVLLGRNIGNQVTVLRGLNDGDRILLEGFQKFQEGMQIDPIVVQDTVAIPINPAEDQVK